MDSAINKDSEFYLLLESYKNKSGGLIPLLQGAQNIYGYLSRDAMKKISETMKIPFSEVYGVATFYAQFRLKPRGKHLIRVCSGTACHVKGGSTILKEVEGLLGIKEGNTSEDLRFTIESVACLGACSLAPVMMINEQTFGRLTKDKINKLLKQYD